MPDEHVEDDLALSDERLAPRAETWKAGWDIDRYLVTHGLAPALIDPLHAELVAD